MQLMTLDMQELALHALAEAEAQQPAPSTERSSETLLSAMLLDVRAHELKQALQTLQKSAQQATAAGAGPSSAAQEIITSTFSTPQVTAAVNTTASAAAAAAPTTSESASNSGTSGASATSSGTCSTPDDAGSSGRGGQRMQRLFETITPAEVFEMQGMNLQEVAGACQHVLLAHVLKTTPPNPACPVLSCPVLNIGICFQCIHAQEAPLLVPETEHNSNPAPQITRYSHKTSCALTAGFEKVD
jgi:hypothetical protein